MRRIGVGVLALAALFAGACGSNSDSKDSSSPTTVKASSSGALSKIAAGNIADVCGSKAAIAMGAAAAAAQQNGVNYGSEIDALEAAARVAPSEIKDDFALLATKLKPFLRAMADANGDYTKLAEAFKNAAQDLDSAEYKAAAQHIDTWFTEHCK